MTILVNRQDGDESSVYGYLIRFNASNGNIEFATRGPSSDATFTLIRRPYLERWYHVAVKRAANTVIGYVDGRSVFTEDVSAIGNSATTAGISVGGWASGKYFYGDIQEAAIYQRALTDAQIFDRRFQDQTAFQGLNGYYKLGFNTNAPVQLNNFAPGRSNQLLTNGPIVFEETDRAGEQSLFDAQKNRGEQSIAPLSGGFSWEQTGLARPVPGIAFDFRFGYSSASASPGAKIGLLDPYADPPLSQGWRHTFETRLIPDDQFQGELLLMRWDGSIETWTNAIGGVYRTRHREYRGELVQTNGGYEWTTPERLVYRYRGLENGTVMSGRLDAIRDFNGNTVQVLWNEGEGQITNVIDTAGGRYLFNYDSSSGLLTNVSFGQWQVNFAYATNRLVSKTLTNTSGVYHAANTTWQFQYETNGLLARIIDPRGNTNTTIQYDQYGRQTNQVDALSRPSATRYGVPGKRQITRIDPGTNSWIETYDRKGHIKAQQDPLTNITSYTYDTNGNRISITEPLGWQTTLGYDSRANVIAKTNALGEITRWGFHSFFNKATNDITALNWTNSYAYDAAGNLTNHADALGSLVRYTYSTNGLVLTSTDANGNTSQFAYDTNGFLTTRTDPANNTWQFDVNEVGWKTREINPFNDPTSFAYDLNGNLVQTIDPLNRTFTRQYDANGNLTAQSDGKSQFTYHTFDAANQRIATTNRIGTNWVFTFTSRGKPERVIAPLVGSTTNFYDSANRLIAVSDPLGNTITNQYDANGNSFALFDVLGQRWSKTFDRLNRVIAESDPLGNTKTTTFDVAGRIKTITSPNGFPSQHEYDGRGRLVKWTDPENFPWLYAYDGNANITNITDALTGHYVMTYGPRNERILERNQDNFEWQYTYDQLLRLKKQRDPNGTERVRNYDPASRVTSHTLSTGREDTYAYDDNDNPRVIVRRVNSVAVATTSLTYDALDRVTRAIDPFNQSVDYGFDALSRITSITYPGNHTLTNRYDSLSRLTNQVDWAARQMKYSYDKAGRLTRREYPNGVVQTNTFDSAGRLTSLSHVASNIQPSTINVALAYAYDRNGNKTGNSERGTLAWPMPTLVDETSHFTPSGRITNRVDALNPVTNNFTYQYDASGNMTNATGAGQTWRLVYDEDNRVTSLFWTNGALNDKVITNRYDALGRRISRKVVDDGVETRYVLDLSGGMERILCDTTASGQITAYYIHGPDLCYRVDATNNVLCYHADAQANIISVTDGGGTNLAQYAYTPYGRSLGSTNSQSQISNPYLFVGSQGVMEELPGLYFMRARYYSADAGVFLSTDPVKKIGAGSKPVVYPYVNGNPLASIDPQGADAIKAGISLSLSGAFFVGGEWSRGLGIAIETDALNAGDFANAWGIYIETGLEGTLGAAIAAGSGVQFKLSGGSSGYGVKSLEGASDFSGKANYEAGVARVSIATDGDWSLGLGPKVKAGVDVSGGWLGTTVVSGGWLGTTVKSFGSRTTPQISPANQTMAGRTVSSSTQPSTLNLVQTAPKSSPAGNSGNNGGGAGGSGGNRSPSGGSGGSSSTTYTVKAGDTLGNIGYNYGSSATAIGAANGIQNLNLIYPGQVLTIRRP